MDGVPRSKITPPVIRPDHLARPALVDALERGGDLDLTLVCAPPGSGKTSLLAEWVHAGPDIPTAWVRVDREDADPRRFWSAVLAALAALPAVPADSRLRRLVVSSGTVELDFLAELVASLDALPAPVRLVLDDAHHLAGPGVASGLLTLVRRRRSGIRLVLAGRHDPALPLARMRLEDRLCEIRADRLRFSPDETEALLDRCGVPLAPAQVALLHARTEGWAVGLRLAALSLAGHPDPDRFLADFSGDERSVADYLVDEVLAGLEPRQRETLRRVSVADHLPAGLAVELAGHEDAAEVLDDLTARTGLLAVTGTRDTRFHIPELLRSYLVADLRRHGPDLARAQHRLAAAWWSDHGRPAESLAHATAAADPALVTGLLHRWAAHLVARGDLAVLGRAVDAVPESDLDADPWLASAAVHVHLARGDDDAVRAALRRARRAGPLPKDSDVAAFRAATERLAGAGRAAGPREVTPEDPVLAALVRVGRAAAGVADQRGRGAPDDLELAIALARSADLPLLETQALCLLAVAAWIRGDVRAATAAAETGVAAAVEQDRAAAWWATAARAVLAHASLVDGRPHAALRAVAAAEEPAPARRHPAVVYALRCARGAALFDTGERSAGLLELQRARTELGDAAVPATVSTTGALLEHRCAVELGHHTAASGVERWLAGLDPARPELHLLRGWARGSTGSHREMRDAVAPLLDEDTRPVLAHSVVEAWLVESRGLLAQGDRSGARRALQTAVAHAEPWGALRPFAFAGAGIRALMVDQLGETGDRAAFATRALASRSDTPVPTAGVLGVLSTREREILTRLPSLHSLDDIAGDLAVSVNTVKSHVRAIYGKLGVTTRRAAVLAAHEQDLLR